MKGKIFALASALTLLFTVVPALACDGCYDGWLVGTVDTYFYNDGPKAIFNEMVTVEDGSEGIIENIVVPSGGDGELMVVKNSDFFYHYHGDYVSLNEDKLINYEPDGCWGDVEIQKDVWWGDDGWGKAEVYREAFSDGVTDILKVVGVGEGFFMDRIETGNDILVYQSVGLNQPPTCEDPEPPEPLHPPYCTWCAK